MGRVRIFTPFKSCGFRGSLFLIIFILLTIGVLFSPVSSQAYEDDLEKDLQNDLARSKVIVESILTKLGQGALTVPEITQLKSIAENVRIANLLMEERFKLREEKARTLGSNALARHQAMVEGYRKALTDYLTLIDNLPSDGTIPQSVIRSLQSLLDKLLPKRKRPIIGSLPYKHLNYPSREPGAAPAITPAYRGGNKTVSPDDTKDTPEAPINKEIATLAQSLNWNPVSIYEYVKNSIETEWYWGCMKGAEETLRQKSGNDCDQATLLTALLRASGFPTRYVRGTIEFFPNIERAKNLTGISDPLKIAEFFRKAGIPYKPVIAGGKITNIQIEHIWVESQIPYANYRGAIIDEHGKTWLGLDTSIKVKDYVYNTPQDIFEQTAISGQLSAVRDEYLGAVQTLTPLEFFKEKLSALSGQPNADGFKLNRTLPEERMNILPAGMQFVEKSINGEYIEIPDELKHKVRFIARTTQNSELLNVELDLMKLSNQQIAISYEPETVEDQEIINSWGGLGNTPAYLVRLRPVLKVGGQRSAVGTDGLPMGEDYDLTIEITSPNGKETIDNTQVTGNLTTVGIVAQKSAVDTKIQEGDNAETILFKEANAYINRWNQAEEELASLFHLRIARPLPVVVTVGGVIDVTYLMDTPHGFSWKGVYIDADERAIETVPGYGTAGSALSPGEREKTFMQLSSLQGSVLENRIFEDDFQVESISTAKLIGIARASQPPAEILTIDSTTIDTILPTIPFEQNVKDDIINSVNQNLIVRIPAQELTHENWAGTGYIKEHPDTGESGYMLSGMIAGGMTAWSIDRWSTVIAGILANTYAEPANYDPASARYIQKIVATDMENGLVGDTLPRPLQVKVTDNNHQPVTGALVTFTIKAGGGSLAGIDAEGNQVTGTSITVTTNPAGIASAKLTLGISTASNPTFMKLLDSHNQIYGEAIQVGENIVDAALAAGTGIAAPFTAYGFPKGPHHMNKLFGDGYWSAVLSFAGYVKVGIEDIYGNPVSNVKLNFTVGSAVPNPDYSACAVQNPRPAYFIPQGTACVNDIPAWGSCGDTSAQTLPVTSGSTGAMAYVVLGGTPRALYPVQVTCVNAADPGLCTDPATGQPFKADFTLKTYNWGNCSGYEPPEDVLVGMYVEPVDSYGKNINAGKTGTSIPLQTKLYYLEEGDTTVNFTYTGCSNGAMTCPLIVGTKQYTIDTGSGPDTKFTESKVTFSPQGGAPVVVTNHDNNGLYRTLHTLTSGVNTITVEGTATIQRDKSNNTCNGCSTLPNRPITQNVMSTVTVYGVDVTLQDPGPVFVDENGYSLNNLTVQYTINPQEYKANMAYVMVYKDGEYITAIPAEKQGTGTATISRGFQFDINKRYEVQAVLNYGSGVEIRSDKITLQIGMLAIEKQDPEFPDVKLRWNDYYPALGSKTITLKASSSLNGKTVTCRVVEPTEAAMANNVSMTMPGCGSDNPQIANGTVKFRLTGTDLAPMVNNDPTTGVNDIKIRFSIDQNPTAPAIEATYHVRNNTNTTFQDVLNGEAVFSADTVNVVSTSTGTTPDTRGFDYVQELLNQVVPRARQTFDDTTNQWVPNQYALLHINGIYSDASYIAVMQFKRSFGLSADASDTYRKIKKDYGLSATDTNNWWWFYKVIEKEALIGKTRRIPADSETIIATNADTVPNSSPDNTTGDTGLYELYKNVVERFVNKMIAEGELYLHSRGNNYPQANTSWRARTGETVTESESYCFGCKDKYDDFWRTVTRRRACNPNVTDSYPTCSVTYDASGCDSITTGYGGNVNDSTGAYNSNKQYSGLKQAEYDLWADKPGVVDCSGDSRFNPLTWAGIDCAGFVQRVSNYAEFDQGTMTTAWNINTHIGDIRSSLAAAIMAQDFFAAARVSYWSNPDTTANQAILQGKLRKGDLVRYGNTHNSMIYSDTPTCGNDSCAYEIIHASGYNQICYQPSDGTPQWCQFNRKVVRNEINDDLQSSTLINPTGFGRIKLWD